MGTRHCCELNGEEPKKSSKPTP